MMYLLGTTRRADITLYANGRIDLTARVVKMLSLRDGDIIDVACDGREYLLFKKMDAVMAFGNHEARVRPSKRGVKSSHNMRAYSKRLCMAMLRLAGKEDRLCVPVGKPVHLPNGKVALPIIYQYGIEKINT